MTIDVHDEQIDDVIIKIRIKIQRIKTNKLREFISTFRLGLLIELRSLRKKMVLLTSKTEFNSIKFIK